MDWNTADLNSWPAKLVTKVGHKWRSVRSQKYYSNESIERQREKDALKRRQRQLELARQPTDSSGRTEVNELGEREYSIFSETSTLVDQPVVDHTDMLHRLAHHDSFDSLVDHPEVKAKLKDPFFEGKDLAELVISIKDEERIASLPEAIWQHIASYLNVADTACLAMSSKTLTKKLGADPIQVLREAHNRHAKISFLHRLDRDLPNHLLCFPCNKFHLRTQQGKESLKADFVSNPLFLCPNVRNTYLPRTRLVHKRELPYSFVQLTTRSQKHGSAHGLHADQLSRRWKCKDSGWTHQTRYMIHDGRLLVRVISSNHAPPAKICTATMERHLLYDREDYIPFFSVCSHWRDGELMRLCKCALSHVPAPPDPYHKQLQRAPKISRSAARPNFIVRGCDECRPARRCPECPTEYLIEIQMVEDPKDPVTRFKHAIVVTRWSDLGDGSSPFTSPEWVAVNGVKKLKEEGEEENPGAAAYESFSHVGRRAVAGIFESRISGSIPGQRMLSLNPKNEKYGEEGHGWY